MLAGLALLLFAFLFWLLVLRGDEQYTVTAEFSNASQLVEGNEVTIGGTGVGLINRIDLGPNGEALVTFTVDDEHAPLMRGTTATVRWRSLSSQAAREVQLTVPAGGDGEARRSRTAARSSMSETVGEVDIDQFFNTLDDKTTKGLKRVIQGFERSYEGVETEARARLQVPQSAALPVAPHLRRAHLGQRDARELPRQRVELLGRAGRARSGRLRSSSGI